MQLTQEQQDHVRQWASQGATLGEIHKRIEEEFGVRMTYMDARFLISDLGISIQSKEREDQKKPEAAPAPDSDEAEEIGFDEAEGGSGGVRVAVDDIAIPNAMISGKVTFSDGERATWLVDPMGRLSLDPVTPGYRPSEPDIVVFQTELQKAVSGMM